MGVKLEIHQSERISQGCKILVDGHEIELHGIDIYLKAREAPEIIMRAYLDDIDVVLEKVTAGQVAVITEK